MIAWLWVHVVSAALAMTAILVAFVCAGVYLRGAFASPASGSPASVALPSQGRLDKLTSWAVVGAWLLWTTMLVSGSVWANQAWGRYWTWDPIETWSLIVWLALCAYLVMNGALGWRGVRPAMLVLGLLPLAVFCAAGVPLVYHTIHAAYMTQPL